MWENSKVETKEQSVTEKQAAYPFPSGKHLTAVKEDLKGIYITETVTNFRIQDGQRLAVISARKGL